MKALTRYEKIQAVHRFLNLLHDDLRLNWHHTVENTYEFLDGQGDIVIGKDESFNGESIVFNINK